MIKILFFIETLEGGGAEKVLRNLVNSMDLSRFDVTVKTAWPCDFEKYLVSGIRYGSMYSSRSSISILRYRIEAELGLSYRLHLKGDYDIECAYLEAGATKVMAASTNKKAKKLAWVHCDLTKKTDNPIELVENTRAYYKKYDRVICVSANVRESFNALFGDDFKTEVIHNTADDTDILSRAQLTESDACDMPHMTVISLGRLTAQKNYLRLLKVHKRLIDEGIRHSLWILGEGEQRPLLEEFIEANGLSDTVRLMGFKENPYPYMNNADLLVCSSDYEGFSTFVTEGMILGKPVVTTDCTGMREILGDSEYGLITELSDEELFEGMKRMLTDEKLRSRYAAKAAERGKDFSARALTEKTESFFEELLN